jgi:HK97 gp10 family phage protein
MFESNTAEFDAKFNKAMVKALTSIGLHVTSEAKPLAPVDTGNLRASISHVINVPEKGVMVGSNLNYSLFIEKGTSRMKAQPFLEPAVMNNKTQIQNIVRREFDGL